MSDEKNEAPAAAAPAAGMNKILLGLAGGAMLLSLVNTVLLVMNPTAGKVEQMNEQLKTDLADSVESVHKKIDRLRSAEVEWQEVLKKAQEKPNALYKITLSGDGLLTLSEVSPPAEAAH